MGHQKKEPVIVLSTVVCGMSEQSEQLPLTLG